jgi:hypothetical protein
MIRHLCVLFGLGAALAFAQERPVDSVTSKQHRHEICPLRLLLHRIVEKPALRGQVLGIDEQGELYPVPAAEVPPILRKKHNDYFWILRNIPRSATSLVSSVRPTPIAWSGGMAAQAADDIPPPGNWVVLKTPLGWYFAITFPNGWHFRIGPRFDYVDGYYQIFSVALKKLNLSNGM